MGDYTKEKKQTAKPKHQQKSVKRIPTADTHTCTIKKLANALIRNRTRAVKANPISRTAFSTTSFLTAPVRDGWQLSVIIIDPAHQINLGQRMAFLRRFVGKNAVGGEGSESQRTTKKEKGGKKEKKKRKKNVYRNLQKEIRSEVPKINGVFWVLRTLSGWLLYYVVEGNKIYEEMPLVLVIVFHDR